MADLKRRAAEVNKRLAERYPDAKCSLDFTNAFELLIATILSAQSTDVRVNIVTKALFRKYPNATAFANAEQVEMETDVKQTGFFRNKAKAVIACGKALVERHGGEVPKTMDELVALPGVGRKTANVVLGNAHGINVGVVVDTHVGRVSGRLGLTENADPVEIEQDLVKLVPQSEWTVFAHRVIYHGRETCIARKPQCDVCVLNDLCPSAEVAAEITADRSSPAASRGRTARSAKPSAKSPSRSRTLQSPRGRKPSKSV
ncbi:MAG TPA: endonuclease III [Thermoanaerobaculia bacterium]|nr:endonuclease III [Thermoanaerobaculia bacterium]